MLALSTMIDSDCRDPPNKTFSWWLIDVIFFTLCNSFFNVGRDGGFFFFTEKYKVLYLFLKFYWCTVDLQCCVSGIPSESVRHVLSSPTQYIYLLFLRFFSHIGHYRILNGVLCSIVDLYYM